ncbi:MAG TPA: lasso RiPP family leader peptide-containing protein [Thermomicrobiales bacterium]|nr:lasso RiPP family leader peptide-containing protein [Thermomicrobiales bacterium]
MKRLYHSPTLVEFGRVDQLTLGGGSPNSDYAYVGTSTNLITNPTAPNCFTSVPYGACLPTSGPGSSSQPLTT